MTKSSFSELLQKKAETYEAETRRNKQMIDEWVASAGKLLEQLRCWLAESDPSRILQIEAEQAEISEPNVGRYRAPRLEIRAFGKWVGVIPKARKTIKTARPPQHGAPERATGRVDITDEVRRYVLYRFGTEGTESWCIEDPSSGTCQPLTRERFEEAMMSYFE